MINFLYLSAKKQKSCYRTVTELLSFDDRIVMKLLLANG